ncbi:hypothetical protein EST38_g2713 [Candolleomyces aberdarensis]|uniref:Uncharacterized protein n=1 Tax=Candolleomyces aberdarensis TaxID=2316362 RepID=A0A4Q2DU20_9AGAR|nr:hypothetical protein EST38_g2713 [Candolleomyces aberdarensis]
MDISSGCPEPLERIFRQVEEESERRAEEEQLRAVRMALAKVEDSKVKTRRRGSISISRLGQFVTPEETSVPSPRDGSQTPSTPKRFSSLASSSPFYQSQLANASTSSIASGASAFSNDHAHAEDPDQVIQVQQIAPKQSIASKMIPRRLSRARPPMVTSGDPIIGVSVQETTVHSSAPSEEGGEHTPAARVTVTSVHAGLRSQPSRASLTGTTSSNSSGGWVSRARGFTQKFRRKTKQDSQSPASPTSPTSS